MSKLLKVLEVLEATEGGTRRHLLDLLDFLPRDRFAVSVACSTRRDPAFFGDIVRLRAGGIPVHAIPMRRSIRPLSDALACARLVRLMRRGRFDVVHTHSSKAGFIGRLAARAAGVPRVIHTPHVFPFQMAVSPVLRFCYLQCERLAARFCDRLVCVCPGQRETALRLVPPERVAVIENGIGRPPDADPAARERLRRQLGLRDDDLAAAVIGRFTRQKGHMDFVQAARIVAARVPAARFLLVGDGPLRGAVERAIASAELQGRFILTGARDDAERLAEAADLVVMPSLWEGLPYGLLEALRAGRAVVASRVGGMADVIRDGVNGLLVAPSCPGDLAAAMLNMLENRERRFIMEQHARETVANRYRLDDMIAAVAALYEEP